MGSLNDKGLLKDKRQPKDKKLSRDIERKYSMDTVGDSSSQDLTVFHRRCLADLHYQDVGSRPKDRCLCNRSFRVGYDRSGHPAVAVDRYPRCDISMYCQYVSSGYDSKYSLSWYVMTACSQLWVVVKVHNFHCTVHKHLCLLF
jgi:hypothetical protein